MPPETEYKRPHAPKGMTPSLIESGDDRVGNNGEQRPRGNPDQQDTNLSRQDDSSGQSQEPGFNSSQLNQTTKEKLAVSKLEASLPRFGPMHGEDIDSIKFAKEQAWEHIMNNSPEGLRTDASYLTPVKRLLQDKLKDTYNSCHIVDEPKDSNDHFEWRMVKDGCFFLQLALYILGGGKHLGYPERHPYFGNDKEKELSSWMHAMFFPENQIPYVLIRELMKQDFFKDVIEQGIKDGTWSRRPGREELLKLVLYLTVVEPELGTSVPSSSGLFSKMMIFKKNLPRDPEDPKDTKVTKDILHGLHCLLLGPGNDPVYSEIRQFQADVDDGREEDGKEKDRFRSAGELKRSWIILRKAKQGITKIHLTNCFFFALLYVPPLTIDGDTEVTLKNLVNYERQVGEGDLEVTAYLRLMRDLIQTHDDFKHLEKSGIIQVKDGNYKKHVVNLLNEFASSKFTPNLRYTRRKITEYRGPPWKLFGALISILTVVQTILAVLTYKREIS